MRRIFTTLKISRPSMGQLFSKYFSSGTTLTPEPSRNVDLLQERPRNPTRGIASEIAHSTRTSPSDDPEIINVTSVDLNIANNTQEHNTDEYDITDKLEDDKLGFLVIRRGHKFNMKIEFDRKFDIEKDDLRLVFQFGKSPLPTKGTHAEFIVSEKDVPNSWGANIESVDAKGICLTVMTPFTCPVGIWRLHFDVVARNDNKTTVYRYTHEDPIYILFNPWCRDDQVYMHDTNLLNEYVLSEKGGIYKGSSRWPFSTPWNFGQFTGNILDCILYLLDESTLKDHARGDPVLVSRKLSALINSSDRSGVLTGNWTGNYEGGKSPSDWTGSVEILKEFYETKQPVLYGQCWVFSGVLTTACRTLGIPARSVTNYASAHDTDYSVTIDTYVDHKGEEIDYLNHDSVWNFHVWNDVWMARPDLPSGYGGWQAIDATPQEASDGVYRMGPMPLAAIKSGEVTLPYDGKFVFAEVNGDKVVWIRGEDGKMRVKSIFKNYVGRKISTKEPFGDRRQDVTDQYKYAEGTDEERASIRRAYRTVAERVEDPLYKNVPKDVNFGLITKEDTNLGNTIKISLKMKNTTMEERTVEGTLMIHSMSYTGVVHGLIQKKSLDLIILKPEEEREEEFNVEVNEYLNCLTDHCICKVSGMCLVKQTKQVFSEIDELQLQKPHLEIKAPDEGIAGEKYTFEVSFTNPLPVPLTKCEIVVDGAHLPMPIRHNQKNVEGLQQFTGEFDITPKKPGEREFNVAFNCVEIHGITGSHAIKIKKKQSKK